MGNAGKKIFRVNLRNGFGWLDGQEKRICMGTMTQTSSLNTGGRGKQEGMAAYHDAESKFVVEEESCSYLLLRRNEFFEPVNISV